MTCKQCGCTDENGCNVGGFNCSWSDLELSLCTACEAENRLVEVIRHRPRARSLGDFLEVVLIKHFGGSDDLDLANFAGDVARDMAAVPGR